ncbi:MAG: succinyldiaminopimelate transaminase [Candidatus Ancillula sp.]|jgi:succinyldiaminopimelate transaminase|nr:succinyldiaminopimelate transaminase [Candidatus Ancillula sp.]
MSVKQLLETEFPWDALSKYKKIATEFCAQAGGKVVDLSVGSPIDQVDQTIQQALSSAAGKPGYPLTIGNIELRSAIVEWLEKWRSVEGVGVDNIIPTLGSKEAVGLLPLLLNLGPGDVVVRPKFAYPTYDIGAKLAGCEVLATDDVSDWRGNPRVKAVWINYPNNPTGAVASKEELKEIVEAAREVGAVVLSDECYALLNWEGESAGDGTIQEATQATQASKSSKSSPCILEDEICSSRFDDIIMLYSFSKQLNLAGYRSAFIAGDAKLVEKVTHLRKHLGLIVPEPVQAATVAAAKDVSATKKQYQIYRSRRERLKHFLLRADYEIDASQGGLYLWVKSKHGDCWRDVEDFARCGVVVTPGTFYGCTEHFRVSIIASEDDLEQLVELL